MNPTSLDLLIVALGFSPLLVGLVLLARREGGSRGLVGHLARVWGFSWR